MSPPTAARALLEFVISGDVCRTAVSDSVEQLYRRYGPAIYARCRRLLRNDAAAEDATQEVFLKVLRHIERAPNDVAALHWIYRISTNHCLRVLRDAARHAAPTEDGDMPDLPSEHPEALHLNRDLATRLILRSPQNLRAPALLHHVDGIEHAHVATMLGISRRTVINRLNAFADRARKFVAREAGGEP